MLLFKIYYVFWNAFSFGMDGMQYRAMAFFSLSVIAFLNFINHQWNLFILADLNSSTIFIIFMLIYLGGLWYISSKKEILEGYNKIVGIEKLMYVIMAIICSFLSLKCMTIR